jgi:amino-acid N-acetyltransferase
VAPDLVVRCARPQDATAIARLNNTFADEGQMLRRTPEMISLALDDYLVVQNTAGELLACGALKEYSPSVAEVAAIAVAKEAHGKGLGRAIVLAAEARHLRRVRAHAPAGVLRGHRI